MTSFEYVDYEGTIKAIVDGLSAWETIKKEPRCDKYDFGFVVGSHRFCSIKLPEITLHSRRGYYGSSSCSPFFRVGHEKLFISAFVAYLNQNKIAILDEIAKYLEAQSQTKRRQEIEKLEERLHELRQGDYKKEQPS